jgi:ABC-type branched-subunit amino acid transport system substrate-binding protein
VSSFQSAGKKDGLDVVSPELISLTAGPAEVSAAASAAQAAGAEAVYIDLANQEFTMFSDFKAEGFNPDIVMYGFGNAAAPALCETFGSTEAANVVGLNPWPELAYAQKNDPAFNKAAMAYTGKPGTDSELALWATDEVIGKALNAVKGSLTRQSLLKALSKATLHAPMMAPIHFTSSNHLGTTAEFMLGLSCSSPNQWTTISIANA